MSVTKSLSVPCRQKKSRVRAIVPSRSGRGAWLGAGFGAGGTFWKFEAPTVWITPAAEGRDGSAEGG